MLGLSDALALLTCKPAEILGVEAGTLAVGNTADVCIFDPEARWTLNPETLISRGRNTPFRGWKFRGRVTQTLVGGKVVFDAGVR